MGHPNLTVMGRRAALAGLSALAQKTGYPVGVYVEGAPRGLPGLLFTSTRSWAEAHRPEITRFRSAIAEAVAFERDHPDEAKAILVKYINLPADLARSVALPQLQTDVTRPQMEFWITVMTAQDMLHQTPDLSALILQ